MKILIIKSNHGNHTGFNRKWSIVDYPSTIEDAYKSMMELAVECSDDYIYSEATKSIIKNPELTNGIDTIYTYGDESFWDDGYSYQIITEEDYEDFFNSDNGYISSEIEEYFARHMDLGIEMYYCIDPNFFKSPHTDNIRSLNNENVEEVLKCAEENDIKILYDEYMDCDEYQNTILENSHVTLEELDFRKYDKIRVIIFSQNIEF